MTGASVLFYGRRNRAGRSASDSDDLGFLSSSSDRTHRHRTRSTSREAVTTTSTSARCDRRHLHPRCDHHARQNPNVSLGEFNEFGISASNRRQPCSETIVPESGPIQLHGDVTEAPIQNIVHGDILNSNRDRFDSDDRLPRSVLLAKERLLQRLRGEPVSSVRQVDESPSGSHSNYWLDDSGNGQTSNSGEQLAETSFITGSPQSPGQLQESVSKPPILDIEAFASFHHEVFIEVKEVDGNPETSVSDECSICLESFVEGNELIGLPCGHRFHSSCLCPWIQSYGKCPYCRSGI